RAGIPSGWGRRPANAAAAARSRDACQLDVAGRRSVPYRPRPRLPRGQRTVRSAEATVIPLRRSARTVGCEAGASVTTAVTWFHSTTVWGDTAPSFSLDAST